MMATDKTVLEDTILGCFSLSHDHGTSIDWSSLNHSRWLEAMKEFLESIVGLLQPFTQCLITQGPTDSGVDLLISFSDPAFKIGFQILGYNDHLKADYNVSATADVTKSHMFSLERYVIVFATDPKIHQKKIAYLITELLKSQSGYVKFIESHQIAPLLSKDNWIRMRARGLSTLLGPLDSSGSIPEPISSDNERVSSALVQGCSNIADPVVRQIYDAAMLRLQEKDLLGAEQLLLEARLSGATGKPKAPFGVNTSVA
jgi:hypothetical protein